MQYFMYGEKEIAHLSARDKRLGAAIAHIGHIERPVNPDLFSALINSIVGQQISSSAQQTIWLRMCEGLGEITPASVAGLSIEDIQRFGMSFRKAEYIHGIAGEALCGALDLDAIGTFSDAEVCKRLCALRGVGVWTAEMLMLFSMQRPDILSFGDLAILRGMRMLYNLKSIDRRRFEVYRKRYSPCGSVASLYLWAISAGAMPGLSDRAQAGKGGKGPG